MKYFRNTICFSAITIAIDLGVFSCAENVKAADYYQEGIVLSTDLLSGVSDEAWITGFTATSSVPASTTVGFLFSVDQVNWYNLKNIILKNT